MRKQASVARVSGSGQDEEGQLPELAAHARDRGHEEVHVERIYAKSASKGLHLEQLESVIRMVEAGIVDVVALCDVDRFSRQGILATLTLVKRIYDAGGTVEFVSMPDLWDKGYDDIESALSEEADDAKREGQRREARKARGFNLVMKRGAALRKPKYGWDMEGSKRQKFWTINEDRATVAREIFRMVAAGRSLREVRAYALQADPSRKWAIETLRDMIKDRAYIGTASTTVTVDGEKISYSHEVPAIVDEEVWTLANGTIGTPKTLRPKSKWRFTGLIFCHCGGRMLRRAPNTRGNHHRYWHCKVCNFTCRDDKVSGTADQTLRVCASELYEETVVKPVDTRAVRRTALERELADIGRSGLSPEQMVKRITEIQAALAAIAAEPAPRGSIDRKPTGETLGSLYEAMADSGTPEAEMNEVLRKHNVRFTIMDSDGSAIMNFGVSLDAEMLDFD